MPSAGSTAPEPKQPQRRHHEQGSWLPCLECEYITRRISLRELRRGHGIRAHSLVVVQARQGDWRPKREAYLARESATLITHHADRMAAREAEVRDHALGAIDKAISTVRADMRRTEHRLVGGEWIEGPVMTITPRDIALLIDRLQVLCDRPSTISKGRGLGVTAEVTPATLREFIERIRGLAAPTPQERRSHEDRSVWTTEARDRAADPGAGRRDLLPPAV